jgi:serine/threonine-protein kinase
MTSLASNELVDFIIAREIVPSPLVEQLTSEGKDFESAEQLLDELAKRGWLSQYQRSQLLSGQGEKLVFGPYRLVEPLGEGGMGMVFKARHPRLDRLVALKFILPDHQEARSKVISRFHREARAIAQLQHPNVVTLYDADEIDGTPYIAMEYIDGVSLWDMVRRHGALGINQSSEYMRQAALGLQHAFECGLVHRDIKPSNIMVVQKKNSSQIALRRPTLVTVRDRERGLDSVISSRSDLIKILDMGLALLKDSLKDTRRQNETSLTEMGAAIGTPDFVSPEQARDARTVDIRADLYSLGCTFYYILSGHVPFPGGSRIEKILQHQLDVPMSISVLRPHIPSRIAGIVEKLMAKNPDERYRSPQELADALAAHLEAPQTPVGTPGQSSRKAASPPITSSQATRITLPSLVASRPAKKTPAPVVDEPAANASTGEPQAVAESGIPGIMNTQISFKEIDFGEAERTDADMETLGNLSAEMPSIGISPLWKGQGHTSMVSAVALSADGRLAASADVNGQIRIWDLTEDAPREEMSVHRPSEIQAIAFSPVDWNHVVYATQLNGKANFVRWDWTTNQSVEWGGLVTLNHSGVGCLRFSLDGSVLAAGVGSQAVTWRFEDAAATNQTIHKGHETPIRAIAISPDRVMLVASGQSEAIRFWGLGKRDRKDGVAARTHAASISTLDFSPDGKLLALAGLDPKIAIWRIGKSSDDSVAVLSGHATNLMHVQFTPDGDHLISVGADGKVFVWDVATAAVVHELTLDLKLAYRVAISADASRLIAGFSNGSIAFFDLSLATSIPYADRVSLESIRA